MPGIWEIFSINYSGFLLAQSAWTLMVLRVVLGVIFLSDGLPKIKNIRGEAGNFELLGFKPNKPFGVAVILLEGIGGIFLVLGIFTQIAALLLAIQMLASSIWKVRLEGKISKEFWFSIILAVSALAIATNGAGSLSLGSYFRLY